MLLANSENLAYNHRRTLARNVTEIDKAPRPSASCAHHIVALKDKEARQSRFLLFRVGIGINDGDNGVFLPRCGSGLPGYPKAAHHTPFHAALYHMTVWDRLRVHDDQPATRGELRDLKADLRAGRLSLS